MFREIKPQEIKDNPFELIGKEWLLVAANKDGKSNAMTASWGAVPPGAAHSLSAVCSVYPVIPVSCGSNGDNAKQANKRYGNVRHNPAS